MISQTLNQRKSECLLWHGGLGGAFMFWYERNKKARYALHIGLNQSVIKAGDALIMIFFELLYSY